MNIINKPLSEIDRYKNNPRINMDAVKAVAESIKAFGFLQPIVIDCNNEIIAGDTRYQAAEVLNLKTVPCVYADDLTPDAIKAYRLADNKVGEIAKWDFKLLDIELKEVNIDMSGFGFDALDIDIDNIIEDEYEIVLPEEPRAKLGDIYQLGNHRLMCGDSTNKDNMAQLMNDATADMVFTDPPWNVDYGGSTHPTWKSRSIMNDSMDTEEFKVFIKEAFNNMVLVAKKGCILYIVMAGQSWGDLMLILTEADCHWSSTIIWSKDSFVLSRKDYHTQYEPIWYGWYGSPRLHPLTDRTQSDLWEIPRPKKSEEHPTMKPIELVARAIKNSSIKGAAVLDLFGGSGTTMIAAEQTERACYMMELDPKYIDVIIKRWEEYTDNKAIKL